MRWLRVSGLLWGTTFILWLGIEDVSATPAVWLAALLCAGLAVRWALRHADRAALRLVLVGALAGAVVTLVALGLMAVKAGLHGHGAPEYSLRQMAAVLGQTPWWALGGGALGGAGALLANSDDRRG